MSGERSVAALPDRERMLTFSSAFLPSPRGEGGPLAVDEVHLKSVPDSGHECSPSLKPAERSPSPPGIRARDTLWGGLEGFRGERNPSTKISGADSGFRRTLCLHPRRAKRRALVCGEVTVQRDEQGKHAPRRGAGVQVTSSTAERSPFPSRGRT